MWCWIVGHFDANVASFFVSFCALGLTIYQGHSTNYHNKISVKPMLTTVATFLPLQHHPGVFVYEESLLNSGLGPAYIKSYEILINGKPSGVKNPQELFSIIRKIIPESKFLEDSSTLSLFKKDAVIASGSSYSIAKIVLEPNALVDVREQLSQFQILVHYDSAYNQHFIYNSRDHD